MCRRNPFLKYSLFPRSQSILLWFSVFGLIAACSNDGRATPTEEIFRKARGAVVEILTQDKSGAALKMGTGFFTSSDGILLTNRHVIEGAASIGAKNEQGGYFFCQGILAEPKDTDLVVLKFEAKDVPFLELASDIDAVPGQKVIVIGNPLGLEGSVSEGIISARRTDRGLVQISAPISPGSSGSPVLTEDGKVIGVATLQSNEGQNLNFAIPADTVRGVLAGLDPKNPVALATGNSAIKPDDDLESDLGRAKDLLNSDQTIALRLLEKYLLRRPDNADAWIMRAQCCYFKSLSEDAVESAQKAVDLQPGNIHYWRSLIQCIWVMAHGTPDPPSVGTTDAALITRLHRTAEHMLAMGDDFDLVWTSMISTTKALGDPKLAAQFQDEFVRLYNSGEIATDVGGFGGYCEQRKLNGIYMLDCAGVAKKNNLEMHEDSKMLTLSGKGHTFNILKTGSGVCIDGVFLNRHLNPYKYKDGRYFVDGDLVGHVFDPVLSPNAWTLGFQINSLYLQPLLPKSTSKEEKIATAKALYAAVKFNSSLFNEREGAFPIPSKALLVYLTCLRDDAHNAAYSCMSGLGAQPEPPSDRAHWSPFDQYFRDNAASLFQIYFAQILGQAVPQVVVLPSTTVVSTPFPTTNPTLIVTLFLPTAKLESEAIFTQVARSLADAVARFNAEVSKQQ